MAVAANNLTMEQGASSAPSIQDILDQAGKLGQGMEDLVSNRGRFTVCCDRDDLLIAYWALVFEHGKGIHCLLQNKFYAPAFALWRPLLEAMVRACVSLKGTESDVVKIRRDHYKMDFEKAGGQVADAMGVEPALFRGLFKSAQRTLHSLTHSGVRQLHGRFDGNDVVASYPEEGIRALIASCTAAAFVVTLLVARHFRWETEEIQAAQLWNEYCSLTTAPSTAGNE